MLRTLSIVVLAALLITQTGCSKRTGVSIAQNSEAAQDPKIAAKDDRPAGSFAFPDDKGGKLLAELLTTAGGSDGTPAGKRDKRAMPLPLKGPAALEHPDMQPPQTGASPGLPSATLTPKPVPVKPHSLPEEAPLLRYSLDAVTIPRRDDLPAGPRTRIDSIDVDKPTGIPILAQPVPDRASLEDPSKNMSTLSALAVILPERNGPTPFLKLTLPDPFENSQTVRLRTLPAEEATPTSPGPKAPNP